MGNYFPKLSQNQVFIQLDDKGNGFNCPMLPVSKLADLEECSAVLKGIESVESYGVAKKKLIALAKTVIPEQYAPNLERLTVEMLVELVAYLMYGDVKNDDQPKPEKN